MAKATLQRFMRDSYYTMALGLVVSGMVAFAVERVPFLYHLFLGFPLVFIAIFAPAIFVWLGYSRQRIERMESNKVTTSYFAYSAVMGVSLTALFGIFTQGLMGPMFFIAAAAFAATAFFGQLTRRPIGRLDSILVMAAAGGLCILVAAHLMGLSLLQTVACAIVLAVFAGIAAWERHILEETFTHGLDLNDPLRLSVTGAFIMYMGFMGFFEALWSLNPSAKKRR